MLERTVTCQSIRLTASRVRPAAFLLPLVVGRQSYQKVGLLSALAADGMLAKSSYAHVGHASNEGFQAPLFTRSLVERCRLAKCKPHNE